MPRIEQPPDAVPLSTLRQGRQNHSLLPPDQIQDAETSTAGSSSDLVHLSQDTSRQGSPFAGLPHPDAYKSGKGAGGHEEDEDSDFEHWGDGASDEADVEAQDMPSDLRPSLQHPRMSQAHAPLLPGDKQNGQPPPLNQRRSARFHERDPAQMAKDATKKRYTYAACFLGLSLVTFAIQTETAVYIQHNLHWNKAYCML